MALWFGLLCGLCSATLMDIHVDLDLRLAAGCNLGVDLPLLPVSTLSPPENVTRFAFGTCENRLDLGWTLYPNDTIVFQLTRNGSFTAQCVSDKATLAPCTIYAQPSIAEIFKIKPTGIYPDCTAPGNVLVPAAPLSVTTAPTLDVRISGGIATGVGSCFGASYLYYMPPRELNATTVQGSTRCDVVTYNYTVESNGDITHYVRSRYNPPTWWINCTTSALNSTCSGSYSSTASIIYLYSFSVLRYGAITQSISTGTCGQSPAPTTPGTTLPPSRAPTTPGTTLAPTTDTTNDGSSLIPGLFFSLFLYLLL